MIGISCVVLEKVLWLEASVFIDRRLRLRAPTRRSTTTPATTRTHAAGSGGSAGGPAAVRSGAAAGATVAPADVR